MAEQQEPMQAQQQEEQQEATVLSALFASKRWGALVALLFLSLTAWATSVPMDPRSNPNVTPLDLYMLNALHIGDAVSVYGFAPPLIERVNAGSNWNQVETQRNVFSYSKGLGNLYSSSITSQTNANGWIPRAQANGEQLLYTMIGIPAWAASSGSTASGTISTAPWDVPWNADGTARSISETCSKVNSTSSTSTGAGDTPTGPDCITKEFYTGLMQAVCHVDRKPANPLSGQCDIHYFEGINEYTSTGGSWGGALTTGCAPGNTTGGTCAGTASYKQLAQMNIDARNVVKTYCADCYWLLGSVSCGGDSLGTCDANQAILLDDWHALTTALPDGISFHPYQDTEAVWPTPMPETTISGDGTGAAGNTSDVAPFNLTGKGSAYCTSANTPNTKCRYSLLGTITAMRNVVRARSWLPSNLPMFGTESGPYFNPEEADIDTTDPLTSAAYTNTIQRAYIAREALAIADFNAWPGGGLMNNNWYQAENGCFGTEFFNGVGYNGYNSGASYSTCVHGSSTFNNPAWPSGLSPYGQAHKTVQGWIGQISNYTQHCGAADGSTATYNSLWTCKVNLTPSGTGQFYWDTHWEATQTVVTNYPTYQDLQGNVHTVASNGQVTVGMEPIFLYGTPTIITGGNSVALHGITPRSRHRR